MPKAQSPTDGCPGWALPSGVATCAQPRASKRDWPTWRGCRLPSLGTATGLGAEPGTLPLAAAQPCPAWLPSLAAHGWGCRTKSGVGCPPPLPDVKRRHGALRAPRSCAVNDTLDLGSQKVRNTQCVQSH